jgi:hypothetical protein
MRVRPFGIPDYPRDAITLAHVREATIEIVCEPCQRRGRYNVERLIVKHRAGMRMTDLQATLANCLKGAQAFSIYDRCRARYAQYYWG